MEETDIIICLKRLCFDNNNNNNKKNKSLMYGPILAIHY